MAPTAAGPQPSGAPQHASQHASQHGPQQASQPASQHGLRRASQPASQQGRRQASQHGQPHAPLVAVLTGFAAELRAAGLPVGTGDVLTYCRAMAALDLADLADLYWAGRSTLIRKAADIPGYDQAFRQYFLGAQPPPDGLPQLTAAPDAGARATLVVPAAEPGSRGEPADQALLGWMASGAEALRHKSFAACTPDELAALRRIMTRIRLTPPRRRTRRTEPDRSRRSGRRPDLRRTVRASMRTGGEPARLHWRRRRVRLRPLILILDISGSMSDYSRSLLQFAHCAKRAAGRVEVFCFGTRLTRVTGALAGRRPDEALERAARTAFDWDGGTQIGDCLTAFVRDWGRRGLCRGGVVVICSDGLDRGDPAVLAAAAERLSLLCHRLVWLNPHQGNEPGARPAALGLMVAAPHIDLLLPGHDLSSLARLAALLPTLG